MKRYFLSRDNSGHWYVVDADHRTDWGAWLSIPEDDERAWEAPPYARPVGGDPALVEFKDPQF